MVTKISGLPNMMASIDTSAWRKWYCMREAPSGPVEADCSATGLFVKGTSFMRDTQSIAFFRPPGIDQLYSGETMMTPSELRISDAQVLTSGGSPEASLRSAL